MIAERMRYGYDGWTASFATGEDAVVLRGEILGIPERIVIHTPCDVREVQPAIVGAIERLKDARYTAIGPEFRMAKRLVVNGSTAAPPWNDA